ncbi:MAG: phosphoenolpyruvate--protein phosphotransferase [candidate division Zixibacteria bacterium]|nr:phosphoenolpyruvate--protein phosphotransferase [candidate division Zixibacteria bacterium]
MKNEPVKEIRIKGIGASSGIAIGMSFDHEVEGQPIVRRTVSAPRIEAEVRRLSQAISVAKVELVKIREDAGRAIGHRLAKIFEAELLILEDSEFFKQVAAEIRKSQVNAEFAYQRQVSRTVKSLTASEDRYLREMADDIRATAGRVLANLVGSVSQKLRNNRGKIAFANSFSPGEVVLMDKYRIPGFACTHGGPTSHAVLVARSLSIPAVIGVTGLFQKCPGDCKVIIDGDAGLVIGNPSSETVSYYRTEAKKRQSLKSKQLRNLTRIGNTTRDGRRIEVCANIDFPSETDKMLSAGQVGVGLYRTEFFYLSQNQFPTEEQQYDIYRGIAETFFPRSVTLRLFDLGSDKMSKNHQAQEEINPALGWRGIRFGLDSVDVFKTQVKAILRASEWKNIKIMLPMVSSAQEIGRAKRMIRAAMKELKHQGVKFDEKIEVGIMVEVPSAALISSTLARHVDFFSLGTNDLAQYTLAVDRGNKKIAKLYRELHPGVLKLIKMTIDASAAASIPVSLCGEMAGNALAIPLLIGLGLKIFSVIPPSLPRVKRMISRMEYIECRELADRVMMQTTTEKVEALLRKWYAERFGEKDVEL